MFPSYLTMKNMVTLKPRLVVTHSANLCMICRSVKYTNKKLCFCRW